MNRECASQILIVDDDPNIREFMASILQHAGYRTLCAPDAENGLQQLQSQRFDVIITDIKLPGKSGIEFLQTAHQLAPEIPTILITGNPNLTTAIEAVRTHSVMDYLAKPIDRQHILITVHRAAEIKRMRDENRRLAEKNRQYRHHLEEMVEAKSRELATSYRELRTSYDFSMESMVAMLDAREQATGQHSIRVRDLALIVAKKMAFSAQELDAIARGTLLHDIGKIGIPDAILLKRDPLSEAEWVVMRTHVQIGYDIVKASPFLAPAAEIVLSHHEKYDGSGYPRGLKGDEICLGARIFSVIDAYDAMRSARIYQRAICREPATEEIIRCSGSHFDPEIVDLFLQCQRELEACVPWDQLPRQTIKEEDPT